LGNEPRFSAVITFSTSNRWHTLREIRRVIRGLGALKKSMSVNGTKRTSNYRLPMSAFWGKPDIEI
jgi:hypothetical protein